MGEPSSVLGERWRRGRRALESDRWSGSRSQRGYVALRMPQVVVRITGKSRGAAKVWKRIWYASHEGDLWLEREDGTRAEGADRAIVGGFRLKAQVPQGYRVGQ